jgi:hypothetical protein
MGYPRFGMIDLLKRLGGLRHQERAAMSKRRLAEAGPPVMPSPSHIVPGPGVASIPELGERLALGYQSHIASSREQAIREAASHWNMKMFGESRLVRALTDEQIAAVRGRRVSRRGAPRRVSVAGGPYH